MGTSYKGAIRTAWSLSPAPDECNFKGCSCSIWSDESQDDELLKVIPVDFSNSLLRAEIRVRNKAKIPTFPYSNF